MQHDDLVYVGQMVDVARKIDERNQRLTRESFDADEDARLALAHLVQTLGEAARRVSSAFCNAHPEIPWSAIVGMRHRIVHDYLSVDFDLVWDVTTHEIPTLLPKLHALLPETD
jgi:uncharacterized protein with HEPN domain